MFPNWLMCPSLNCGQVVIILIFEIAVGQIKQIVQIPIALQDFNQITGEIDLLDQDSDDLRVIAMPVSVS